MHTIGSLLALYDVAVPDELIAGMEVPVIGDEPQRQGDVFICPRKALTAAEREAAAQVPPEGLAVVRGEATGNTHLLHAEGAVVFARRESGVMLGVVEVAEGATTYLIHTDEHGANAMGPGAYALHGKRTMASEIRRVAD